MCNMIDVEKWVPNFLCKIIEKFKKNVLEELKNIYQNLWNLINLIDL